MESLAAFRCTKLHINAIIALFVLLLMFGAVACLAYTEIAEEETDAATMQALVALMGAAIGGVVYVVKQFASVSTEDGEAPDSNGRDDGRYESPQ